MTDPIAAQSSYPALTAWWNAKLLEAPAILDGAGIVSLWWGYRLFGDGIVQDADELNQTLTVVVGTPQGSDIHRPEFSTGVWNFIDYPINRLSPYVVRESVEAVETWEPRLELTAIAVSQTDTAQVTVNASWQILETEIEGQTDVNIGSQ